MTRVILAATSAEARALVARCLGADPDIALVAVVSGGRDLVGAVHQVRPDIVLLDARLAAPPAAEVTREIMTDVPTPVMVLLASADVDAAQRARAALAAGALVIVEMPRPESLEPPRDCEPEFVTMTKAMAAVKVVRRRPPRPTPTTPNRGMPNITTPHRGVPNVALPRRFQLVVIASSTGGPAALRTILSELPIGFPAPVLVVQHISRDFARVLVRWIAGLLRVRVRLADHGEPLLPGTVYFAPDDVHLGVHRDGTVRLSADDDVDGFRPSATYLFESAAREYGRGVLAVVLTGMGSDGVSGLHAVREAGGRVLAQDEASSVVFGMPGEAARAGLVDEVLPVHLLGQRLIQLVTGETDAA